MKKHYPGEFNDLQFIKDIREETAKEIFEALKESYQFACLESWCKSRKGKIYCRNCREFNELKNKFVVATRCK